MSEILNEENAIILAAATKMVEYGSLCGQNSEAGEESEEEYEEGLKLFKLLKAYRKKDDLTTLELEALLSCLRDLSDEDTFPSISPLIGQTLSIQVRRGATGPTGPQGTQGSQGTRGSLGSTGPQGTQGSRGTQGSQGSQGSLGPTGPQGTQGSIGVQGTQGTQGSAGSNMRNPSVTSRATASSPQPNANSDDVYEITAQDLTTAAFQITSGTAVNGQRLVIRLTATSGTSGPAGGNITWQDATFGFTGTTTGNAGILGTTLPSSFIKGKKIVCEFMYDTANSFNRWQLISRNQNVS